MSKNNIYHEENVFPISMGRETKLREVLEKFCKEKSLRLFDGEEFIDPAELLADQNAEEFLDLSVKYDEFGIYDFFIKSDEPLFSYALPCPSCGKYVKVLSKEDSNPEDFCECKGKQG